MKRSRSTEEQIIGVLKVHQTGLIAARMMRGQKASLPTFCKSGGSGRDSEKKSLDPMATTGEPSTIGTQFGEY